LVRRRGRKTVGTLCAIMRAIRKRHETGSKIAPIAENSAASDPPKLE
jgi:hypothetical protein